MCHTTADGEACGEFASSAQGPLGSGTLYNNKRLAYRG